MGECAERDKDRESRGVMGEERERERGNWKGG